MYRRYEPLSLMPAAADWVAVYSVDEEPGWITEPLLAWAVYRVSQHPTVYDADRPIKHEDNEILGVVDCGGYFGPPNEAGNFWRYQRADQVPTAAEIKAARLALNYEVKNRPESKIGA